jgi:hypothetical protein
LPEKSLICVEGKEGIPTCKEIQGRREDEERRRVREEQGEEGEGRIDT